MNPALVSTRWDKLYHRGRYVEDPPIPFAKKVLSVLQTSSLRNSAGLYIGCGNGRNYLPLVNSGLDLYGLDLSAAALRQLAGKEPTIADLLIHADFREFHSQMQFGYVIAIQVFQHGFSVDVAKYFSNVRSILMPGGLFFLRVNSSSTHICRPHTFAEKNEFGGKTIIYQSGPKQGLPVHFYAGEEILELNRYGFELVDKLREDFIQRTPPEEGHWTQWE